jgi:hypothetical protein
VAPKGPLGRDDRRRKLLIINRKIKEAAQSKQLGRALDEFARLERLGIAPSVHTYTRHVAWLRRGVSCATDTAETGLF